MEMNPQQSAAQKNSTHLQETARQPYKTPTLTRLGALIVDTAGSLPSGGPTDGILVYKSGIP